MDRVFRAAAAPVKPGAVAPVKPGMAESNVVALERAFLGARERSPDLRGRVAAALDGFGPVPPRLAAAALAIAHAMDTLALTRPEPAYHNRHHAAEATTAMAALCRRAQDAGLLDTDQAAYGVVAMVGHDMEHDGSARTGGVLEARSRAAVLPHLRRAGLDRAVVDAIGDIILGTNPAEVHANADRVAGRRPPGAMGPAQDVLRVLANEADICASVLPSLGPRIARLLAQEWAAADRPGRQEAETAAGRLAFLRAYPAFSAPAHALGLHAARERCFAIYCQIGESWDGVATPEAGCAALDRLAPAAAAAAYAAALEATAAA